MKKPFLLLAVSAFLLFSCEEVSSISFDNVEEAVAYYQGPLSFSWDGNNIIHIPQELIGNINACIDSTMEQKYIDATIAAIEEYNEFDFIFIGYNIKPNCGEEYMVFGQYDDRERDYCSEDDSRTVACNLSQYNSETGEIAYSQLMYNDNVMDNMTYEDIINTAIHEIGHTFGLNDLYEDKLAEVSIMYYQTSEYVFIELQPFDIANLNWFYGEGGIWKSF
jgi:predicted Zn-dependent protease